VARGYLNRPELTAERFIPDPFTSPSVPGARLYKTGDLARYLPDGNIEFLGRVDHQVKVRGFRIELGEIEAALGQHPALQAAIVLAWEDGAGTKRLVAYVVPEKDTAPGVSELRSFLQEKLPDYMVPSAFVTLDALPLTPTGKVDRRALPAPDGARPEVENVYVAPRTPEEEIVAGIWAQILGLERVGIHDNFFELGGHSLLATRLVSRLRDDLQVEVPLRTLFETPTVAGLAESIRRKMWAAQDLSIPPIQPVPRDRDLPLSFAQQRLWFLDQLEPGSPFYNIPTAVRLTGPLDVAALERTLNEIVRRHEALRTTFETVDGRARQVIAPELTVPLPVTDLTDLPETEREAEALQLATQEAQRPFDLARGPLLRARLLRLGREDHVALLTMHHIVSDGWSMGILIQEIAALYEAFSSGRPSPLQELPIQYADFAHWQREWLQGEILEAQLSYWKQQLDGSPPLLELPTDRPRPAVQSFRGRTQAFALPKDLSKAIKDLGHQEGATLFMTLLAAFQSLLYRYTGQETINVGTPIANRTQSEIEGLIGFFVNTLVMRADLSGDPSFRELLKRVREMALGAYAHQDLPFEMLVDALQPERNLSHSPLFQVMFVLQEAPMGAQALSNLTLRGVEAETGVAKFDLTLSMAEDGDGLGGVFEYNVDLFDAATIERMIAHFQRLLEGIVADPNRPISELPLLTEAEREQLLVEWNDTQADYPQACCIHKLFEAQVEWTSDAVAVVFEGEKLTYDELNRQANQLAHHLRKLGVGPETLVGICVERSPEMIVGLLGILKAGGAYVPLDPTYPQERLAFMLEDTRSPVLLTQAHLLDRLDVIRNMQHVTCLDADWETIAQEGDANPINGVRSENLAYVIYTSGSTGRPKGVLITHQSLVHSISARFIYYREPVTSLLLLPSFAFDASVVGIFWTLCQGGTLVIPQPGFEQDLPQIPELIAKNRISHLLGLPSLHALLLEQGEPQQMASLRTAVVGGEACTRELTERHNELLPQTSLFNEYGPTEGTVWCSVYESRPQELETRVPIGRPIANAQIYLLDSHLQPAPVGVPGELHIGGAGVARGYLNRPELTAERFIPDPFSDEPGARLYKTGDLARYQPDGNIEFLGRIDYQVKVRGFRIELGEIEAVLGQHPAVQAAVVLAREDEPGEKRLVAYVVPEGEAAPSVSELRSFLKEKLPEYMVPSAFVTLDTLPLTPTGKVDRRALPAPDRARPELEAVYVAPRTRQEEILADIWAQVLGVERVGVHDTFFELGGDSILSIQVIARANQAGLQLSPKQIFQYPTIEGLAKVAGTAEAVLAEQGIVTGLVPLTPIQHWFFEQHPIAPHHWNTSLFLELGQALDVALLERTVKELLIHHDALRLRFTLPSPPSESGREKGGGGWQQVNVDVEEAVPFSYIDLSGVARREQKEVIESAAAALQTSLDLSQGPLMQVAYFDLGPRRTDRLLLIFHHLVMDGVSWRVFTEDFLTVYQQLSRGEPVQLPPKTTSFQYWARRLSEYAQSSELRQELDHWMQISAKEVPSLPVDYPGGVYTYGSTDSVVISLSAAETQALLQKVPAVYGTQVNDVLLTALVKAFAHWTGKRTLLLEMEGHGREDIVGGVDLSRTVGWFTSSFPVLLDLEDANGPGEELQAVKEQLRRIPNRGIGYGLLRYLCEDDQIREQLSALPKPEVNFNYLGQFGQASPPEGTGEKPDQGLLDRIWRTLRGRSADQIRIARESVGPEQSPEGTPGTRLNIVGIVTGGKFQLRSVYSKNLHKRGTIERLTKDFAEELRSLIAHCLSLEVRET